MSDRPDGFATNQLRFSRRTGNLQQLWHRLDLGEDGRSLGTSDEWRDVPWVDDREPPTE